MQTKLSIQDGLKNEIIVSFENDKGRVNTIFLDTIEYHLLKSHFEKEVPFIAPSENDIREWFYQGSDHADHLIRNVTNADIVLTIKAALDHFANLE